MPDELGSDQNNNEYIAFPILEDQEHANPSFSVYLNLEQLTKFLEIRYVQYLH